MSDIDECKTNTKKVDDALEKTKGEIDEKFEKEIKEVRVRLNEYSILNQSAQLCRISNYAKYEMI